MILLSAYAKPVDKEISDHMIATNATVTRPQLIVREHDEKAFDCYLTKNLVLAYMNAVAAGDLTTVVKL